MRRGANFVLFILPTDDLIREFKVTELLLERADLTLQILTTYIVDQWVCGEHNWGHPSCPVEMTAYEVVLNHAFMDFLSGAGERDMDRSDRRAIEIIIKSFCTELFESVVPILKNLRLSDNQMAALKVDRWAGDSLVVRTLKE